jgi:LCP family protein required for cell wall assembly
MTPTGGEKPYRVYRGGRVKGKVPTLERERRRGAPERDGRAGLGRLRFGKRGEGGPPGGTARRTAQPKKRRYGRWLLTAIGVFVLLVIIWSIAAFFSFRSGVVAANKRLPKAAKHALTHQNGLLLTHSTNILLLGTDHSKAKSRAADRHADSMMLLHTDPDHHRLIYLSIMRDLRVEIPGYGTQKINAAYQFGGPALAIKTVEAATGLPVNHVVLVNFTEFEDLIDKLGGVTINIPKPILSNKFDCPFNAQKCASWRGWRFGKGSHHLDGRRALIYSRIRENQLDPRDTDATRIVRQQQVIQAITSKLSSPWSFVKMPFIGGDLMKPTATDLSAGQLTQLGWVKFRAGTPWRCRLGGTSDGSGYIVRDEEALRVIAVLKGESAPQPPLPGSLFGSGCVTSGKAKL